MDYGFKKVIPLEFDAAVEKVKAKLMEESFGVLTTIDVKETFKKKLGIDFKKYVILGACNPSFAHKSLTMEEDIGLLLPCNVIVYEKDNQTVVAFIKPSSAMGMVDNEGLKGLAQEVENKLKRAFEAV